MDIEEKFVNSPLMTPILSEWLDLYKTIQKKNQAIPLWVSFFHIFGFLTYFSSIAKVQYTVGLSKNGNSFEIFYPFFE
jgi:hypothetical protein